MFDKFIYCTHKITATQARNLETEHDRYDNINQLFKPICHCYILLMFVIICYTEGQIHKIHIPVDERASVEERAKIKQLVADLLRQSVDILKIADKLGDESTTVAKKLRKINLEIGETVRIHGLENIMKSCTSQSLFYKGNKALNYRVLECGFVTSLYLGRLPSSIGFTNYFNSHACHIVTASFIFGTVSWIYI